MPDWRFNLRSGFDSDEDEDANPEQLVQASSAPHSQKHDTNDNSSSHHSAPKVNEDSTSKELQELFGTAEEDKVCYKPNPWSIAKMNANARGTAARLGARKPASKAPWPTKPIKQPGISESTISAFTRPGPFASRPSALKPPKDFGTGLRLPKAPSRSLRDSISAALRRCPDTAFATDNFTADNNNAAIIPKNPIPSDSDTLETYISLTLPGSYSSDDHSPPMPSTHQKASAYIPEHETIISHNSPTAFPQVRSTATCPLGSDISEGHTPSLTWDHPSSDGLISPVKDSHRVVDLQEEFPGVESCNKYSGLPHDYATLSPSLMDPPSPELDPQHLSDAPTSIHLQDELESSNGDYYDSGHVHMAAAMLEPSPTLQQTTQYAAKPSSKASYSDKSRVNEYFQGANIRHQASPNLAYAAPPPISKTFLPSSSHTSTPARKCNRERELDSNDESIIPAIRREPITPLQPARKYTTKPSPWLDPDEEPVWSTLPSRIKKTKQVKAPVATSRFRLPGAFLGSSSPLGEQESKRLYKPPPRKRSTERNEERGRWKVTRIE